MPEQHIISLDATVLNTLQNCAYKTKKAFFDNLRPNIKAEAMEEGELLHYLLEIYYGLKDNCVNMESSTWKLLVEAGIAAGAAFIGPEDNDRREKIIEFAKESGRFFAAKMNATPEDLEEVIYQFTEYAKMYRNEEWHCLAVEEVATKVLHEDEEWKIIWNCKTDFLGEKGSLIAPWDHKSGRRRSTPRNLSNQFRGTCFNLNTNRILINKIGFQKSLSPNERFQRFLIDIPSTIIEEWRIDTIYWAKLLYWYIQNDFWPRNLTSCDKYSGCVFVPVCEKDPNSRLYVIERGFHVGDEWDVAQMLEATQE